MSVKIAIHGYTALGKRLADAIELQDDMEVLGVTKQVPDFEAELLLIKEYPLYVPRELTMDFEDLGFVIEGDTRDLVEEADIVIDTMPPGASGENLTLYKEFKSKAIFQGGSLGVTETVFNSWANFEGALDKDIVRVPNPDVTGLVRSLVPIEDRIGMESVSATILRGMRTWEGRGTPHYSLAPDIDRRYNITSDLQALLPDATAQIQAVEVPFSRLGMQSVMVNLKNPTSSSDLRDIFEKSFRLRVVDSTTGLDTLHQVEVMAQDLGRNRSDLYENVLWGDGVRVNEKSACFFQALGLSNVVPENIDCVRAMLALTDDKMESIGRTDRALAVDL